MGAILALRGAMILTYFNVLTLRQRHGFVLPLKHKAYEHNAHYLEFDTDAECSIRWQQVLARRYGRLASPREINKNQQERMVQIGGQESIAC